MHLLFLKNVHVVYKIGKHRPFIYENFGVWSSNYGLLDLRPTRILSRQRRNLQGHRLIAPTVFFHEGSENNTDLDDFQ